MESSGHFGFTAAVSYILIWTARYLGFGIGWWEGAVIILGSGFLASIPDIDIRLRRIGVRHRGFTHTVWFALILAVLTYVGLDYLVKEGWRPPISPLTASITVALAVLTHIAADAFNYQKVRPLEPIISAGVALGLFRSSSTLANTGFFLIGSGLIAAYFYGIADAEDAVGVVMLGFITVIGLATLLDKSTGRVRRG